MDGFDSRLRRQSRRHVLRALAGSSALAAIGPWGLADAASLLNPAVARRAFADDGERDAVEGETLDWLAAANPAAAAVVDDVVARARVAFTAAAAGLDTGGDRVGAATRRFIAARPPATRASFVNKAQALLQAPASLRSRYFGRYAALPPTQVAILSKPALNQRLGGPPVRAGTISRASLQNTFGPVQVAEEPDLRDVVAPSGDPAAAAEAKNIADGKAFKHLEFFIRRVECFEGTGDPGGHDEISLAGYGVGASGNIAHVDPFLVSENFIPKSQGGQTNHTQTDISARDYGERGRHFLWFQVNQKSPWPHDYQVGVAMGELDWGGFGGFVNDLWDAVSEAVVSALSDAAVDGLSALAGSAIPIPGLGTLIGLAIGALLNFIIQSVKDDVVGTIHTQITLRHMTDSYYKFEYPSDAHPAWHGHLASAQGVTYTRAFHDTGYYKVKMGWRILTDAGFQARQNEIFQQALGH